MSVPGSKARVSVFPVESLVSFPAVAAAACVGAIRLVPFGLGWRRPCSSPGSSWTVASPSRRQRSASPSGVDAEERTGVLVTTLIVAFLGFVGVAAISPGGLVQPAPAGGGGGAPLPETDLLVLVAGDAIIAFLLGYRAGGLRVSNARDALWSAATYAAAVAIGAAAVRFMEIPACSAPPC